MNRRKEYDAFYQKGYLRKVKIFYSNGGHKYANLFRLEDYENGVMLGTIVKYRRMNLIERFFFRNCL